MIGNLLSKHCHYKRASFRNIVEIKNQSADGAGGLGIIRGNKVGESK